MKNEMTSNITKHYTWSGYQILSAVRTAHIQWTNFKHLSAHFIHFASKIVINLSIFLWDLANISSRCGRGRVVPLCRKCVFEVAPPQFKLLHPHLHLSIFQTTVSKHLNAETLIFFKCSLEITCGITECTKQMAKKRYYLAAFNVVFDHRTSASNDTIKLKHLNIVVMLTQNSQNI